jgi:hypothetical protein
MSYWDKFEKEDNYWSRFDKNKPALRPLTESQKAQALNLARQIRPKTDNTFGDYLAQNVADMAYGADRALSGATFGAYDWLKRKTGLGVNQDEYMAMKRYNDGSDMPATAAGVVAEIGGNITGAGGALARGLSKAGLTGLKLASAAGGLEGAAYGVTGSDTLGDLPKNIALSGSLGAGMGAGMPYLLKPATKLVRPVADKISSTYNAGKELLKAKRQLNQLTNDPDVGIVKNIWNKVTGNGKSINDILYEENQRLARQAAKAEKIKTARRNTPENSYTRQEVSGLGSLGSGYRGRWEAGKNVKGAVNAPLSFNEYFPNKENGNRFYQAMSAFKKGAGAKGEQVYQYSPEEYAKMRTFLTDDGKTGFALKDDGDIVSVFNGGAKGGIDSIMPAATSAGGTKLDAYDTFLPGEYSRHGFKEISRDMWNEQFAPNRWNKKAMRKFNLGEPDVVYMKYDPSYYGNYQSPNSLQNVINRLQDNIKNSKEAIRNVWQPQQSIKGDQINRSFVEALANRDKARIMRNGVLSGASDLSERARILQDNLAQRKNGWFDADFEKLIKTPEMAKAEVSYAQFMAKNGGKTLAPEKVNKFYQNHPIAKDIIAEMREVDPRAFDNIAPGSLAEFDMLKKILREEAGNKIKVGASKSGALKRAENSLKELMDTEFPGFKDINTKYAEATSAQNIFESKLNQGLTSVGGGTANVTPFWSGISSPLTAAGVVGGFFNPMSLAVTGAGLAGKALMRNSRRAAARRLADGIMRTPINVDINPVFTNGLSAPALRAASDYQNKQWY